ncbi:H-NS histone family protein [Xanthomonas phaseoli pv. dieffenbachiae]|nr:H-NS histone family protein [Xanthomonas phaseoli pv. dieffenbachiae]
MSSEAGGDGYPKKRGKGNQHKCAGFEFVPLDAEKAPRGKPRYRDPNNPFNTWVGRGKRPDWLRDYLQSGRDLSEFEIPVEE